MINTLTERNIVTGIAFNAAGKVLQRTRDLFLKNLSAAQTRSELSRDRDVEVLANLVSTVDCGLAIRGIFSPSDTEKDAIAAQVLRLLD